MILIQIETSNVIMYVASAASGRLEKRDAAYISGVLETVEEQVKNEELAQQA